MSPIKQVVCKNNIDALIEEQTCIDEMKSTMNYNPAYKITAKHDLQHYRREFNNMKTKKAEQDKQAEKDKWDKIVKYELALLERQSK